MYRDNPVLVRCRGCTVELPLEAAAEGHLCGRCAAAHFSQRAVVLVLGALLAAPIVHVVEAALTFARVSWGGVPSFAERAVELIIFQVAALGLLALAVRQSTARRSPRIGALSGVEIITLITLAVASVAATAGSTWLYYEITRRLGTSVMVLAAFSQDSAELSKIALGLHSLGMLLLFAWSVMRWKRALPA
jgi:hypothetical protein